MQKIKLGVVFGGMSTENEVSVISANSVMKNLNKDTYDIYPIYIDKDGIWWEAEVDLNKTINFGDEICNKVKIENVIQYLKKLEIIFPVLHGLYGEDGTIQGLFEIANVPYVGCRVLASSVGMDKVYTKIIFEKAGLKQAKYEYIRKYKDKYISIDEKMNETIMELEEILNLVTEKLTFPMFVKPSNSGSSVGIHKADNKEQLKEAIQYASEFDNKILIEEGIDGREVECAVLGNEDVIASCVGEIKAADEFYSYDAKYKNQESKTDIPANIPAELQNEIRKQAIKAFKAIDGKGLSRVDFFIENNTQQIYINEINTLPGFTDISMYPKLFEESGISYKELLNKIINLSF